MSDILAEYRELVGRPAVKIRDVVKIGQRLKYAGHLAESERCFRFCVNALKMHIAQDEVELALSVESVIYTPMVKTTETEEHYCECFRQWGPQLQELGRKAQRPLGGPRNPRKICFVLHNGILLGHTEVLFRVVDSWRAQGIDCDLYLAAVEGADEPFKAMLAERGITFIEPPAPTLGAAVDRLRDILQDHDIHTAVWSSPPILANYALAMRLAPRQIFWSVKFHAVWTPEVDAHLCGGHELETTRNYNGHDWTVSPFPLTMSVKANDPAKVQQIRNAYPPGAILLGALAREEKFNSPAYLDAIGSLLARNPRAHFLWTGRQQPQIVLETFRRHEVLDRCRFIGWVDTNLVAGALDVFLETFPFGCGITGFQAMSHGTPLLSFDAPDTLYGYQLQGGVAAQIGDRAMTRSDFENMDILTAADADHYIELAQKLIDDVDYRAQIGAREQAYFQREQDALPRYARRLWANMSGLPG